MTTEEKAKAYDEALDRMKHVVVVPESEKALQALKETIFPELAESEDEKIRMALCDIVRDMPYMETELRAHGLTVEKTIAYLENQNHDGKKWLTPEQFNRIEHLRYEAGFDAGVRSVAEKQKEQKPSERIEMKKSLSDTVITELGKYDGENYWKSPWATDSTGLQYPLYLANLGATWQKEQNSLDISTASEWLREHVCFYMNSEYNEFHKCVEYDGSIDKERLINDFEEAMQKEQKPAIMKPHKGNDCNHYDMGVSEAQEYAINRGFGIPFNDGEVFIDERYMTQTIGNILRWADEHPKEQKPVECIEFANEFENQVSHLLASLMNGEWVYDKSFIKHAAQSLMGYAKNELKPTAFNSATINGEPIPTENQSVSIPLTEWSGEDEKTFWGLTAYIPNEELKRLGVTRFDILKKFKSIRPQSKVEWGEDEKIRKRIVEILDNLPGCYWYGQKEKDDSLSYLERQKGRRPAMIQWTGKNLKEVIEFTGKSGKFEKWFKSFDEYEAYVRASGNILKLFCEGDDHYKVPVGAWIIKTPDGHNVPSCFEFVHKPEEIDENKIIKKHITEDVLSSEVNKRLKECGWYVTGEKPKEWSDEDEKMFNTILKTLQDEYHDLCNDKYGHEEIISDLKSSCRKKMSWFEALPEKFNLKK
jgi:hypothetical protein